MFKSTSSSRCHFIIFVVIIFMIYWLVITPLLYLTVKERKTQHPDRFPDNWPITFWLIAVIVFIGILLIPSIIAICCCDEKKKLDKKNFCETVVINKEDLKPIDNSKGPIRKQFIIPKRNDGIETIQMEKIPQQIKPRNEPIAIRNADELIKRPLRTRKCDSLEISTQTDEEYGIYRSLRSPITPREQFFFSNRYSARGPSLSGDSTYCNYDLTPKVHSQLIKDDELLATNKDLFNFIHKKPVECKVIEEFLRNERKFAENPVLKKKFFIANVSPRETLKSEIFFSVQDDVSHLRQKSLKIDFEDDVFD